MQFTDLKDDSAYAIEKALENHISLQRIDLNNNEIRVEGAK